MLTANFSSGLGRKSSTRYGRNGVAQMISLSSSTTLQLCRLPSAGMLSTGTRLVSCTSPDSSAIAASVSASASAAGAPCALAVKAAEASTAASSLAGDIPGNVFANIQLVHVLMAIL